MLHTWLTGKCTGRCACLTTRTHRTPPCYAPFMVRRELHVHSLGGTQNVLKSRAAQIKGKKCSGPRITHRGGRKSISNVSTQSRVQKARHKSARQGSCDSLFSWWGDWGVHTSGDGAVPYSSIPCYCTALSLPRCVRLRTPLIEHFGTRTHPPSHKGLQEARRKPHCMCVHTPTSSYLHIDGILLMSAKILEALISVRLSFIHCRVC